MQKHSHGLSWLPRWHEEVGSGLPGWCLADPGMRLSEGPALDVSLSRWNQSLSRLPFRARRCVSDHVVVHGAGCQAQKVPIMRSSPFAVCGTPRGQ